MKYVVLFNEYQTDLGNRMTHRGSYPVLAEAVIADGPHKGKTAYTIPTVGHYAKINTMSAPLRHEDDRVVEINVGDTVTIGGQFHLVERLGNQHRTDYYSAADSWAGSLVLVRCSNESCRYCNRPGHGHWVDVNDMEVMK